MPTASAFLRFVEPDKLIIPDLSSETIVPGTHMVFITLSDGELSQRYDFTFIIQGDDTLFFVPEMEEISDQKKRKQELEAEQLANSELDLGDPPEPYISRIDSHGNVRITFSKKMRLISNETYISEGTFIDDSGFEQPVLDVKVLPGDLSEEQNLKFTWNVTKMDFENLYLAL